MKSWLQTPKAGGNTYPNSGKHISAFNVSCLDFLDIIFCAILYISYLSHWNESFNAHVLFISSYAVSNSKYIDNMPQLHVGFGPSKQQDQSMHWHTELLFENFDFVKLPLKPKAGGPV